MIPDDAVLRQFRDDNILSLSISLHYSMTSITANFSISNYIKKNFQIDIRVLKEVIANSYYRRYSE